MKDEQDTPRGMHLGGPPSPWWRILDATMRRSLHAPAVIAVLLVACCGPSTKPDEPVCETEDVTAQAQLVVGPRGAPCNPCSADAELFVEATLSTECGPVEWQLPSTCLVGAVRATRSSDGEVFALETRNCGQAFTEWGVAPDRPLSVWEPSVSLIFGGEPPPADYAFEVEFPSSLGIDPTTFSVTIAPP
ncbi:MAG: hypothetical protein KDK70_29775 [Myxococcales bacterium]|nr:hypothetical protein [Myxococcales bacterium]